MESDLSLKQNQQLTETPSSGFFAYSPKEWEVLVNAIGEQFVNIRTAEIKEISKISQPIYWLVSSQPYNVYKYAINTPYDPTL